MAKRFLGSAPSAPSDVVRKTDLDGQTTSDTTIVRTTGAQSIAGAKTFTDTTTSSSFVGPLTGNASTATTLQTPRTIALSGAITGTATSFNGSANISIPVTSVNLADAAMTGSLPAAKGGTGQTTYTVGDILYASSGSVLSKLASIATGNVLHSGGVGGSPSWGKVSLTSDVSGALPVANGGTGGTTAADARTALGAVNIGGDIMTGNLSINKASASLTVAATSGDSNFQQTAAAGSATNITGYRSASPRWQIVLMSNETESGSNAGANFAINRFSDAGAYNGSAFSIRRSDGLVTIPGVLVCSQSGNFSTVSVAGSVGTTITNSSAGLSGSVYYNNFCVTVVQGSTGILSYQHFPGNYAQWQIQVNGTSNYTFPNSGRAQAPVAWDVVSDVRLKTNFEPLLNALDRIDLIEVLTFERIDEPASMDGPSHPTRYVGVPAQQMQMAMPEGVTVSGTEELPDRLVIASDSSGLLSLAAVKELKALVLSLQAEIAILKGAQAG